MSLWKRIALISILAFCVFFFLLHLSVIGGAWYYKGPFTNGLLDIFQAADSALDRSIILLDRLDAVLNKTSGLVDTLETMFEAVDAGLKDRSDALKTTVTTIQESLDPVVADIADFTNQVHETYIALDTTIQNLNELPFVELETPGDEVVKSIDQSKTSLQDQVADIKESVRGFTTLSAEALDQLRGELSSMKSTIIEIRTQVSNYRTRITNIQNAIGQLQLGIAAMVNRLVIAISIFLFWNALGQGAIFFLAWSALTGDSDESAEN